ncbi:MAG: rRNA maturation RNase YbeY [Firmicutes bacterium]|nr:rRNA maturation RNase YbeY [Bacillota bacterium]
MTVRIEVLHGKELLAEDFIANLEKLLDQMLLDYDLQSGEVAVAIGTDELLHRLNQEYRNQDRPTDVLSFAYLEPGEDTAPGDQEYAVGDIYISIERAEEQADLAGHQLENEIALLAIHGMLHLLGFDHLKDDEAEKMQAKESKYLRLIVPGKEGA